MRRKYVLVAALLLAALVGLGVLGLLGYREARADMRLALSGKQHLLDARDSLAAWRVEESARSFALARSDFETLHARLGRWGLLTDVAKRLPRVGGQVDAALALSALAVDIASAGEEAARGAGYLVTAQAGEDGRQPALTRLLGRSELALPHMRKAVQFASAAEASRAQIDRARAGETLGNLVAQVDDIFPRLQRSLTTAEALLARLPMLAGKDSAKRYLVLAEDNLELRPTGGFIGMYGILHMDGGEVHSVEFHDILHVDADYEPSPEQRLEPPEPFVHYLGVINPAQGLTLRDVNWSPDFPTTARLAERLYRQESGQEVDGVIALTLSSLRRLIRFTGPIAMPQYGETITAENMYERHIYWEFQRTEERKQFWIALATTLFQRVVTAESSTWPALIAALRDGLEAKDVLVYVNDDRIQSLVATSGWDGALRQSADEDYLLQVDADIFARTKASDTVKRRLEVTAQLGEDGSVQHTVTARLESGSPWADQRNYTRLYVPGQARLLNSTARIARGKEEVYAETVAYVLQQDGTYRVTSSRRAIDEAFFAQTSTPRPVPAPVERELEKLAVGSFLYVPHATGLGELSLRYSVPAVVRVTGERRTYTLVVQHQPGVERRSLHVTLGLPQGATDAQVQAPAGAVQVSALEYWLDQSRDAAFVVTFRK